MEAGTLRHLISVERPVAADSGYGAGASAVSWVNVSGSEIPANVRPLRAGEVIRSQQPGMETAYVVKLRYTDIIEPEHRLVWEGLYLYITGITDVNGRHVELEILCNEREDISGE